MNVNPDQLRLFLDPQHHIDTIERSTDTFGVGRAAMQDLWSWKEEEARVPWHPVAPGSGIYDSLKSGEQIHTPVNVRVDDGGFKQWEGHHRIAAAAAYQRDTGIPQHVPVEYIDKRSKGVRPVGEAARASRPKIKEWR